MKTRKYVLKLVVVACLVFGCLVNVRSVLAYKYFVTLPGNNKIIYPSKQIQFRAAGVSFPQGSVWRTALTNVLARWNESPGNFTFLPPIWDDPSVGFFNGQSEVWITSDPEAGARHKPGTLKWNGNTAEWTESDVFFSWIPWPKTSSAPWSVNSDAQFGMVIYGGPAEMWEPAALHEFGHALGLAHENRFYNLLGAHDSHVNVNCEKIRFYVGEDAGNGAVFLYGSDASHGWWDVGVSHFKYAPPSSEYSTHTLTQIFNSNDSVTSSNNFEGVRRYNVKKGNSYKVQFTYENNGVLPISNLSIGYYISTNHCITTCDTRIDSFVGPLARNWPYTMKRNLTIPSTLIVGQTYYLGVIVDYTDQFPEFAEDNNATYIPIKIIP